MGDKKEAESMSRDTSRGGQFVTRCSLLSTPHPHSHPLALMMQENIDIYWHFGGREGNVNISEKKMKLASELGIEFFNKTLAHHEGVK